MLHISTVLERRYRIDYIIKQGGMGTVYGAHDLRLDRPCAVKAVPATSAHESAQFQREARVLGRLCHPHLPAIYDCIEADGMVFVVMQMIPGDDLEGITLRRGPPAWLSVLGWSLQLAEAIHYLHTQTPPVIHRDIKPANIRLAPQGQVYLVDFGIAKVLDGAATATAARAASVPYAPPEQVQDGSHTDQQSDIYAFGATLYRLLTATLPPSCIDRLIGAELQPITAFNPAVPEALDLLVRHCMELRSANRPPTIDHLIENLRAIHTAHLAGEKPAVAPEYRPAMSPHTKPFPPGAAQAAFDHGQRALERGDPVAASSHFTRAIEIAPTFSDAYAARAGAHTALGHFDAAVEDWNVAISQRPRCASWYLQRAAVHRQRKDMAAAIADLTTAIRLNPDRGAAYFERAETRRLAGDERGYLADLDRVLSLTPDHKDARIERARARMQQHLWQSALSDCNVLIEAEPNVVTGYVLRARVYAELGDITRGLRDLSQAIGIDPRSSEAYFLRGRLLQRSGDRQGALRDFNRALDIDPAYAEAWYRRAQLYRTLGAEREALADYRTLRRLLRAQTTPGSPRAATVGPRSGDSPVALEVQYMMRTGGIEKARKYLRANSALFREDSDEDLEARAALFERVGQVDAALDDMERSVKLLLSRQDGKPPQRS